MEKKELKEKILDACMTKNPLFLAMHGKGRGETFTCKGIAYKIK